VKKREKFSERNAIQFWLIFPYRYREIVKTEKVSLSYDANDHVYLKSKSRLSTELNIVKVGQILTWSWAVLRGF